MMSEKTIPQDGALAGIRVLDLTSVVLGPLATQILGDYGAEIIKVEALDGDLMRANGFSRHAGMSSVFLAINRNKRSVAIDLKRPDGVEAIKRLLPGVDVVLHNMRIPAIRRLGLDYEDVQAINPEIVYCAATGFGQDGPDRNKPAFDDIIQAASGIASLVGGPNGQPEYVPSLIADKTAGMAVVNAVLAALVSRARTGYGQYIEVPMLETLVAFNMAEHFGGRAFVPPLGKAGYTRIMDGGRRPTPASDGYLSILPYSPTQWIAFFRRTDREDLLARFDLSDRHKLNASVTQLYKEMALITPARTCEEWLTICEELDIPATPIYSLDTLEDHPHLKAVELFQTMEHPTEGRIRCIRPAVKFARTPASIRRPAPRLGQHTEEILKEAGLDMAEIGRLLDTGVINRTA